MKPQDNTTGGNVKIIEPRNSPRVVSVPQPLGQPGEALFLGVLRSYHCPCAF